MKTKHTPGPWYALKYPDAKTYTVAARESVASKIKTIEDAALIAAAPCMLEALEKFARDIEALKHSTDEADFPLELAEYSTSYIEPYIAQLIAKAKGDVK